MSIADITGVQPEFSTSFVWTFFEAAIPQSGTNNIPNRIIIMDICGAVSK